MGGAVLLRAADPIEGGAPLSADPGQPAPPAGAAAAAATNASSTPTGAPSPLLGTVGNPVRILHLEDSLIDAELIHATLESDGLVFEATRVETRQEFIDQLREGRYDIVLADYNLPRFDGLTALRLAREMAPTLPFLFLSGALGEDVAIESLRSGATDYIIKDNLTRLRAAIGRALLETREKHARVRAEEEMRKARDAAERANRAKSEFLSRMSHELRTPLNAILGYAQFMYSDGEMSDEEREHSTAQIIRAGKHLLQLIDDVLDISRVDIGVMKLSLEPVAVSTVLTEALDIVRPMAQERGVTLHTGDILSAAANEGEETSSGVCNQLAWGDHQRIRQVLLNLLTNAIKYNRESGEVHIECHVRDQRVEVSVRDTGEGIDGENLERLFTAFDRLGAERTRVQGTGLGLALSKGLAEAMGGELVAASIPGAGSTFTLALQICRSGTGRRAELKNALGFTTPARLALGASAEDDMARQADAFPVRVVYIEDDPMNLDFVQRFMARRTEIELHTALDGVSGIEAARRMRPDLVLLDLNLPDMHGSQVLASLRADPDTSAIPVVVCSADATVKQIEELLAAGAISYLTKPLNLDNLLKTIKSIPSNY